MNTDQQNFQESERDRQSSDLPGRDPMTSHPQRSYVESAPPLWRWLPAGIFGGVTGGFGTAWLLWGAPRLLTRSLCFLIKIPVALVMLIGVTTMGCTFILSGHTLIRGILRLIRPRPPLMYEPQEPILEMELIQWPHPGCGLFFILPILFIAGAISVPWLWFAPQQVPLGWLLLSGLVGLPLGLATAIQEAQSALENQTMSRFGR